jgi:hypothetical protein
LFVKFSELQQYGVDRVFLLENANIDSSQRNIVFLVRGEKASHVRTVAGKAASFHMFFLFIDIVIYARMSNMGKGSKDPQYYVDDFHNRRNGKIP